MVLSLEDLSLVWSLQSSLVNTSHKDIFLIGGGFVPEVPAVKQREDGVINEASDWKLFITFSSKNEFGFTVIMQAIDLHDQDGPKVTEATQIPKIYGLTHLECCKHTPMIVGQSSADELFLLKKKFTTDFAGSMYPPGFKIMKTVHAYMEKEDELDKVVRNENGNEGITRVVSESFMKNAKLGADNVENAQQDGLAALRMCTVIGDANTERKEGSIGDVEVDIFTNITSIEI